MMSDNKGHIVYSVVILTFNSEKHIGRCLHELLESFRLLKSNHEIFIIDNGSNDNSISIVNDFQQQIGSNIKLRRFETNVGTTASRNLGLKDAVGDYIIVLDSDAYVNPDAIDKMTKYIGCHPSCGLVCPKLTYPDGRFQLSTDVFPTISRKLKRFLFLKKIENVTNQDVEKATKVDYAISAFWMFRRKLLNSVGLLDEKIFYAPEDVDFCLRVWKAGFSVDYLPFACLVHDAQELSRGFKFNYFTYLHIKGLVYYFIKHRYAFSLKKLYGQLGIRPNVKSE